MGLVMVLEMSFMATKNNVVDMLDPCGITFYRENVSEIILT